MKIVCISDTHKQHYNIKVPVGDVIVCAGDITAVGELSAYKAFSDWYAALPHKHKIMVFGNHECTAETDTQEVLSLLDPSIHVLHNTGVTIEGMKFWGSPYTPAFGDWAFQLHRTPHGFWDQIPEDTNVLVTHGPPFGILDRTNNQSNRGQSPLGDFLLLQRVLRLPDLRAHVFGHIHGCGGQVTRLDDYRALFVNASICTEGYKPKNPPVVIDV